MAEQRQFPVEKKGAPTEAAREEEPARCPRCGSVQPSDRTLPETHPDEAREAWATLVMDTVQESACYHRRKQITNRVFCVLALVPLAAFVYWLLWYPIWSLLSREE